jgi:hypothetical protein
MTANAGGFYHDPPLWIGSSPIDRLNVNFNAFRDVVFTSELPQGLRVKATREGLFSFDFTNWEPGLIASEEDGIRLDFNALADRQLNRTVLMNSWLTFFYTYVLKLQANNIERMVVTPELLVNFHSFDETDSMGFANQHVAHLCQSSFPMTYRMNVPPHSRSADIFATADYRRRSVTCFRSVTRQGSRIRR